MAEAYGSILLVHNEDELYEQLAAALKSEAFRREYGAVRFVQWPVLTVELPYSPRPSSISTSMMEAFTAYQQTIYRIEQFVETSSIDLRSLSKEEKKRFEIIVEVSGGSSTFSVDLTEIFTRLGGEVLAKMDADQLVLLALGFAAIWGGATAFRAFLQSKLETRKAELASDERAAFLNHQSYMSEQETKRLELLLAAQKAAPFLSDAGEIAQEGHAALVRGMADNGGGKVLGVNLEEHVASEIMKTRRQHSKEERIDGVFLVKNVDTTLPDGFRIRIQNILTGDEFYAVLQDRIASEEHYVAVQSAEWTKQPLYLTLRAKRLRGKIVDATVTDARLEQEVSP